MKRKSLHFPIVFLCLLLFSSCEKKENKNEYEKFSTFNEKAGNFEQLYLFDSAYFYYNKAKLFTENHDDRYAYAQLKIALIQQNIGDYFGCEETITETLSTYKETTYLLHFYNLLAVSYHKQNNLQTALFYYKKAADLSNSPFEKAIIQNNIGLIYLEEKEFLKAYQLFNPLLKDTSLLQNPHEFARVQDNLGYTQFHLKNQKSIENLENAWLIRDSLNDYIGKIASAMHLAEYYQYVNQEKAKKYATEAFVVSRKADSPDDQLEALKWLTEFSNPLEAKLYYQKYINLNDSLNRVRNSAKNKFAGIKYDSTKATQEVIKYKNQKEILLVIIALIIAIAFLLYKLYRAKNKRKLQQSTYQTETRISKRIHDELANDVFNTMTFAQTQNLENKNTKDLLLDNLELIYHRTRDISKENSEIRTDANFGPDLYRLLDNYSNPSMSVIRKLSKEMNWQKVSSEKKIALFRVVQELLINTKKHSKATLVVIDFNEQNKRLIVTFIDNGIGLQNTQNRKSGLQNAENRIQAIKGTLIFDPSYQKGCKAIINIPI
jgi:signal transduction histidine kinase